LFGNTPDKHLVLRKSDERQTGKQMSIMDFFNDLLGPLNYIDRIEGLLRGIIYQDMGHRFAVLFADRGGRHSCQEVEALLKRYGIVMYGRMHDAKHFYFLVKKRQAEWAEYLLVHANVAVTSPPINPKNAEYAASHEPGWLPKPWSEQDKDHPDDPQDFIGKISKYLP